MLMPAGDAAVPVEADAHLVDHQRPVAAAAHVVFPRPLQLHRRPPADRLRRLHHLDDNVRIRNRAPAEAAARLHHVHPHLLRRHTRDLRGDRLIGVRELVAAPHLDPVSGSSGDGIERLEGRVRQIGKGVGGLDHAGGAAEPAFGITAARCHPLTRLPGEACIFGEQVRRTALLGLAFVPIYGERVASLDRRPGVLGDHDDSARRLHHVDDAADSLRLACIEGSDGGSEQRRMGDRGGQHTRQAHVDGKLLPTVRLVGGIEAAQTVGADQRPVLRLLQSRVLRHRLSGGGLRQLAESCALARRVRQDTLFDPDLAHGHGPRLGRRSNQHPRAAAPARR